jgi:hypothetical protein
MKDLHNAPDIRIRGWIVVLAVAGFAQASCALAQIYKCTDADGRTAFSDKPCATPPPGAAASAGKDGAKQEVLRQPKSSAGSTSADAISAMCAKSEGSKATDELIQSLPEAQREMVISALRGLISGMARDPAAQEALRRITLTIDASRTAVICVPIRRAQQPGTPGQTTTPYTAFKIEPNGRMVTLQPSAPPQVSNDANEPATMAARCSRIITSCFRSKSPGSSLDPGRSLDECFDKAPVCPAGRLDPAATCCPQVCKDAYHRERARGTDAETATIKVIFGDDAGAASCVPGMPKRG